VQALTAMRRSATPACRRIAGVALAGLLAGCAGLTRLPAPAAPAAAWELHWGGTAKVFAPGQVIEIGVSTALTPFREVRSTSWRLADGPAKARTMIVAADAGWIERDGERTPMKPAMLHHERQQFGLYGLMLAVLGHGGADVELTPVPPLREGLRCVRARRAPAPETVLCVDRDGALALGANQVDAADGGAPVAQQFEFAGVIESRGVRWPRTLRIAHDGKPYFELTLERFEARARAD